MVGVLVTRPKDTGNLLTAKLRQDGYDVWHEPLIVIQTLVTERPKLSTKQPVIALTSRSSILALQEHKNEITDLLTCPCFCVGDQTASEAEAFGFQDIKNVKHDAEALARLMVEAFPEKRTVLHICGEDRSIEPEATLHSYGWEYRPWPVYKAVQIDDLSPEICDIIKAHSINVVLFFSVRTARIFATLIRKHRLEPSTARMTAIGLSQAVISALGSLPFQRSLAASAPYEAELIAKMRSTIPPR